MRQTAINSIDTKHAITTRVNSYMASGTARGNRIFNLVNNTSNRVDKETVSKTQTIV